MFFVLSSYLIASILFNEVRRNGRVGYGGFYRRRVFRLAPALLVWLAVIAAPTAICNGASAPAPVSPATA